MADALIYDAVQKMAAELSALRARVDSIEIRESNVSTLTSSDGTLTAVIVDATGSVTKPYQPAFFAYNSATDLDVTGDGTVATVDFDTEVFDVGANFAADTFTAPVTGKYLLSAQVRIAGLTANNTQGWIYIVVAGTSARSYIGTLANPYTGGVYTFQCTTVAIMTAGDTATVTMTVTATDKGVDIVGGSTPDTRFCGVRIV